MDDCLIVGAGVIGLSLAYELASHGLRVRVLDRQEPGQEASWAGAGILPPANRSTATHPLDELRGMSHQLHAEWAVRLREETGIDTGYRRCGGIYLARTSGEAAALHGMAGDLRELRIECERLSSDSVVTLEPMVSRDIRVAYLLPDEAQIRNPHHLQALVAACCHRGVIIESHVEVMDSTLQEGRMQSLQTTRGERLANQFCFTAGAWTYGLLVKLGVNTGILPIRGQMVLFRCPVKPFQRILNEGSRYLVPRDDGRVLVGSTEEEVGFNKGTTEEAISELKQLAIELVPVLRNSTVERTWAGLRPGSFDGFPYLAAIPGTDNAFVAAGHYRSGLHLSPATAVVMGQLMRGVPPEIDLSPFRLFPRSQAEPGTARTGGSASAAIEKIFKKTEAVASRRRGGASGQ
jgi:glycine oxidase